MQLLSSSDNTHLHSSEFSFWNRRLMKKGVSRCQQLALSIMENKPSIVQSISNTDIKVYLDKAQMRGLLRDVYSPPSYSQGSMEVLKI